MGPGAVSADGRLPPGQSLSSTGSLSRPACVLGGGSKSSIMLFPQVNTRILVSHCPFMAEDGHADLHGICSGKGLLLLNGGSPGLSPWDSAWQLEIWLCTLYSFGQ